MSKQLTLFLLICFLPVFWLNAQHGNAYPDIPYQGKRVFIQKLKLGKANKNGQSFKAILINTGKSLVSNKDFQAQTVLIKTNPSVIENLGSFNIEDLYQALASKSLKLEAGVTNGKYSSWLVQGTSHVLLEEPIVEVEEKVEEKEEQKSEPVVKDPTPSEEKESEVVTASKSEIEKNPIAAVQVDKEPAESIGENKAVVFEQVPTEIIEPQENKTFEESCSDIRIEKLVVVKKTKGSVTLAYTLINEGNGPASIKGMAKNEDNLALRAHLCSSDKLTRGAITLGGSFIKVSDDNAILQSGETLSGELKLPLYKLTKFTPYIVLQADPYQKIIECDETNNINFVNLMPEVKTSDSN